MKTTQKKPFFNENVYIKLGVAIYKKFGIIELGQLLELSRSLDPCLVLGSTLKRANKKGR